MIHIPPYCKVNRILATLMFLVTCMTMQAQFGAYERFSNVLINTSYNSFDQPVYFPSNSNHSTIITSAPMHGTLYASTSQGANAVELVVNYTPDAGFVGLDTAIVEVTIGGIPIPLANIYYAQFVFNVVPSIITTGEDYFTIVKNSSGNYFDIMANDNSTASNLAVDHIVAVMGGSVSISNDSLQFSPNLDFQGLAYLTYTVCDSVGTCKSEVVNICVMDTAMVPVVDTIYLTTALTDNLTEFLPSSSFYPTLTPQHGSLEFIPNSDAFIYHPGMTPGLDVFELSDGTSILFYVVDVIPDYANSFVFDDYASVLVGHKTEIDVKKNDRAGNFQVGTYSQPSHGELQQLTNGVFKYIADTTYTGVVTFDYEVCALQNCETGTVHITVSKFTPKHSIAVHELTGLMNRDLLINYDIPVNAYEFNITSPATNGLVQVHSGLDTITEGCVVSIGHFMITYTPDSGFEGFDAFTLTYCVNGQCTDVEVSVHILDIPVYDTCHCQDQCVWPGDVNFDGLVDMTDLLCLGNSIGDVGYNRPNPQPNIWYGQYCDDWNSQLRGNFLADEKHCDTDGDGYVEVADTSAISAFYGNHHTLIPEQEVTIKPYVIGLEHDLDTTPAIGDTITLFLTIGNHVNPAANLSGVAMNLSFDPNTVDSAYTKITVVSENWITREGLPLFMSRDDDVNFELGLSRIDHESHHGYGRVFAIEIIIDDDLDGLRHSDQSFPITIQAKDIVGIDEHGREFMIPNQPLSFNVRMNDDIIEDKEDYINVFPNPVDDKLHIDHNLSQASSMFISDSQGRIISQFTDNIPTSISTIGLAPGVYIIRIQDGDNVKTAKFLKIH